MNGTSLYEKLTADLEVLNVNHAGCIWMLYYSLTIPGFRTVVLFRLASHFRSVRLAAGFLRQLNMFLHSCDLHPEAEIGGGLFLPHPIGIVVGSHVAIGKAATLYQNVTIGLRHARSTPSDHDYPRLGDHVVVSARATLLGKIHIGNQAVIGANAVVLHDVPDNATAVGNPARIIAHA